MLALYRSAKLHRETKGAISLSIRQTQAVRTTRGRMDVTGVLLGENKFYKGTGLAIIASL